MKWGFMRILEWWFFHYYTNIFFYINFCIYWFWLYFLNVKNVNYGEIETEPTSLNFCNRDNPCGPFSISLFLLTLLHLFSGELIKQVLVLCWKRNSFSFFLMCAYPFTLMFRTLHLIFCCSFFIKYCILIFPILLNILCKLYFDNYI